MTAASALTPGETATLRGRNLSRASAVLVDGLRVPIAASTDTTVSFVAPRLRACDVDGREVPVALAEAPDATLPAKLRLSTTVTLAPGESRVLAAAATGCIQLPASDADYVVSALNPSESPTEGTENLADLTAWTEADPPPADAPEPTKLHASTRTPSYASLMPSILEEPLPWPAPYTASPRLFDPRYASASPGDTVRFVDWTRASSCSQPPESAPSYLVVIAAVHGRTVIAVDLRTPGAMDFLAPPGRAFLQEAAQIADPLFLPAMRRVFDPDFQVLPAAGGRHFHIITSITGVAQSTDGNTSKPQSACPLASEMVTTLLAPPTLANVALGPRILATEMLHEYAHNADEITGRRFRRAGGSRGWMQEAWAVNAEETAARLATSQTTRARLSAVTAGKPYRAGTTNSDWGLYPQRSPWLGAGAYKQGAALISFAREQAHEAALDDPAPSLYLRLLSRDLWTIAALADAMATSTPALLDAWSLADATDDLFPAALASPPRLLSWDDSERLAGNEGPRGGFPVDARPTRAVSRAGNHSTLRLAAAPGSYAAAYLFADRSLGATLQIVRTATGAATLRLTRTR